MNEERNRSRKRSRSKERSTVVTKNKAVMAFLLGKLAQLFYLAHSFAFFLGEIQLSEQQQNSITVRLRELTEGLDTSN